MDVFKKFKRECEELVNDTVETPPKNIDADLAYPCFKLSKNNAEKIAKKLERKLKPRGLIEKIKACGPYLNFYINKKLFSKKVLSNILKKDREYGSSNIGKNKVVIIDFSSPNIAKPMSIAHLRSTIIGDALYRILSFLGYKCIGDNHLGDWGTQFGKLIVAYKKWGKASKLNKEGIKYMLNLYVRFHKEVKKNKKLEDEARIAFNNLEKGEQNTLKLWKKFYNISLKEFKKIYSVLNIKFDYYLGESFYVPMLRDIIKDALKKGVAKISNNAVVVEFKNLPLLLIQKSDSATVYATRDLATLKFRKKKFKFHKCLYVVGSEQRLYFRQIFKLAQMLGYAKEGELIHVDFGLMRLKEGKLSTREGRVIFLEDVIQEGIRKASSIINEKNPRLKNKEKVAKAVAIAALKYADLSRDRIKDIVFNWDDVLKFEGNTGPYLQYTYARACSILRKTKKKPKISGLDNDEFKIIKQLSLFPSVVKNAGKTYKPHFVATYAYELSTIFNEYYHTKRVIGSKKEAERIALVKAVAITLRNAMNLLGIEVLERM